MKWSGGPIVAKGRVSGFRQVENCSPDQLRQVAVGFSLFDLAEYWRSLPPSFFGMSVYLSDEQWLDRLIQPNARSHGSSWLVIEDDEQKDQWLMETVSASTNQIPRNGAAKRSRTIPPSLRFEVFRRDRFTCVYCGATGLGVKLTADHKVPFSKGGETNYENLVTACWECNIGKGAKSL